MAFYYPDAAHERQKIVNDLAEHLIEIDPQTPGQLREAASRAFDYLVRTGVLGYVPAVSQHAVQAAETALSKFETDGTIGLTAAECAEVAVLAAVTSGHLSVPGRNTTMAEVVAWSATKDSEQSPSVED